MNIRGTAPMPPLAPGQLLLERYRLAARLGRGAGGEVWRVDDTLRGDRPLALKMLPDDAPAGALAALRREYRVLAALRHPHLGEAVALGAPPGGPRFLLSEYYPGGDVAAWLASAPPRAHRLRVAAEVLRALVVLHDAGLVHGDLKPGNVVLDAAGHARVVDLGFARRAPADGEPAAAGDGRPAPAGTPDYLAPELLRGEPARPTADLFAYGVLLHELLTGCLPRPAGAPGGETRAEAAALWLRARAAGLGPDLGPVAPALGPLVGPLARLLAPRPEDRFAAAREALRAILDALPADERSPAETADGLLARTPSDRRADRPDVARIAAALLAPAAAEGDGAPARSAAPAPSAAPGAGAATAAAPARSAAPAPSAAPGAGAATAAVTPPGAASAGTGADPPAAAAAVCVVAGPAGCGRSTLLAALRREALLLGWDAPEPTPPRRPEDLPRWLGLALPAHGDAAGALADRLADALLAAAAAGRRFLLTVDDFERAPRAVADLVRLLARTLPPDGLAGLRVVVARRAATPEERAALGEDFAPWTTPAVCWLPPLAPPATAGVLARVFPGREQPRRLVAALHVRCGGNPALLRETLRRLLAAGALPLDDASPLPPDLPPLPVPLPESLEAAARDRLAALPPAARAALHDLVRLSPPVPTAALPGLLAAAADADADGPASESATTESLAALRAAGAVVEQPTADGPALDLADEALRAVLTAALAAHPDRARAARLAAAVGAAADAEPGRLAALYAAAGETGAAAVAATLHGERLLRLGAAADARAAFEQALAWGDEPGDPALRLRLAEAAARLGDPRGAADLLAAAEPRTAAEVAQTALARAEHLIAAGDHATALAVLEGLAAPSPAAERGAAAPGPGSAEPREAWAAALELTRRVLAARARLLLGQHDAARAEGERALGLAARRDDAAGAAAAVRAHTTLALAAFYGGDYEDAAARLERARALVEAGAAPEERPFVLACEGLVLQRTGDLDGAAERYRESARVARLRGDRAREGAARLNLGTVAHEAGDLGAAVAAFEEAVRTARRRDDRPLLVKAGLNLANALTQIGALDEAERQVTATAAVAGAAGLELFAAYAVLIRAELALLRADAEAAAALADEARAAFERIGARRERLECDLVAGRAALARGDGPAAARLGERLAAAGGEEELPRCAAWGHLLRAEAEALRPGGAAGAVPRYRQALAAGGERARAEDRWRIHAGLARCLLLAGEVDAARVEGQRALTLLDGLAAPLRGPLRAAWDALPEHRAARAALGPLVVAAPPAAARSAAGAPGPGGGAAGEGAAPGGAGGLDGAFLAEILEVNKRLAASDDLPRLLALVLDDAIALTGAERGFVLRPGARPTTGGAAGRGAAGRGAAGRGTAARDAPGELTVQVARNIDRETLHPARLEVSMGIARQVLETGEPLLTVDAMEDERLQEQRSVAALRLRSVLCAPLLHRGRTLGVVYVDNRFQRGAFREAQLRRLEAFADQAAIALAHAQALEDERRLAAELETARQQVERLNRELRQDLERRTAALALAEARLRESREELASRYDYRNIVGRSPALRRVFALLDRVTDSTLPVLVTGESGTGKELVARALHFNGPRRARELVSLNCAALPETLLESELFGAARGAYTGADRDRPGFLERAHEGTLFLDEVGDMPLAVQAKLLRVLETGEFSRLGETRPRRADVRVVAATNRDLPARVREGRFREDLFFRLNVVNVALPPLRERPGDLPLLADHLLARHAARSGTPRRRLAPDALVLLERYPWPGNVRELEATLTTAALLADGELLTAADLLVRPELRHAATAPRLAEGAAAAGAAAPGAAAWDGQTTLDEVIHAVVTEAVAHAGGNKALAARALGISRNTLYARLERV
jgi:transcriptional regulator with GAF, ATPase, and Fis domain/tetratricopeptide (TPR) repeat protein